MMILDDAIDTVAAIRNIYRTEKGRYHKNDNAYKHHVQHEEALNVALDIMKAKLRGDLIIKE